MRTYAQRLRRGARALIVATGVACLLCGSDAGAAETNGARIAIDDPAYVAHLVDQFETAAFQLGYRPGDDVDSASYVRKWVDWKDGDTGRQVNPFLFRLYGAEDKYQQFAREVMTELSRLSDMPLVEPPLDSDVKPNFVISFVKPERVDELLLLWNVAAGQRQEYVKLPCVGLNGHTNGTIVIAFIIIKDTLSETETRHCIADEGARALGFRAPDFGPPSVFSGADAGVTELSQEDRILLRALYDKRITVAMSVPDTMALARTIIPELVGKVRAGGQETLYQH
jgi:hypothetical protein